MDCLKEDETNLRRNTNISRRKVTNAEAFMLCPTTNIKGRKIC